MANDPINLVDPTGMFADCGEFQEAGGGACTNITETTTDSDGNETESVVGLQLDQIPTKRLADEHYRSNDALPMFVPADTVLSGGEIDFDALEAAGYGSVKFGSLGGFLTDERARVLGSITLGPASDGEAQIFPDTYNFEFHSLNGDAGRQLRIAGRNIATGIGYPGSGTPFDINFQGTVGPNTTRVTPPPHPGCTGACSRARAR